MSANPPAVPPVTFRPTVVVGLGGMGTFVAYRVMELVRRQLDRHVRAGLITQEIGTQAMAERFKFVAIDSDEPWYKDKFGPNFFRIGTTTDVNNTLDLRYLREAEFQRWWHRPPNGRWWEPGDYAFGAGHIRLKGRLAYFLEREQGRLDVGERIKSAVGESTALVQELALGRNEKVSVFVCTSLSGGTGGGTFLTVMNSIKAIPQTRTYGVVIGSSIADMQSDGDRKRQERANFRAGLMELDAWLTADSPLLEALDWEVFWPDPERPIRGERPCADVVWLFDRQRAEGGQFNSQLEAINASAEAIATWVHSSATQQINSVDADVMSAVAGLANVQVPTVNRSVRYGAMGVAHLEFAADRALDYLSTALAIDVIRDHVLARQPGTQERVNELVDTALRRWELIEKGQDQILAVLRGLRQTAPPAPALGGSLNSAPTTKASYAPVVKAAVERLDAPDGRHAWYRGACARWTQTRLGGSLQESGLRDLLRDEVSRIITSSAGGFAVAVEFLAALEARITGPEASSLHFDLEDPRDGLAAQRARLDARRGSEVEQLSGRFGRERRIGEFVAGWWKTWLDVNAEIVARQAALDLYDGVVEEVRTQRTALASSRASLDTMTEQLRRREGEALSPPSVAERGAETINVLTQDPHLLRQTFSPARDAEEVAAAFAADPGDGLVLLFSACLDQQRVIDAPADERPDRRRAQTQEKQLASRRLAAILADPRFAGRLDDLCAAQFLAAVRACSVWDALEAQVRSSGPSADWDDLGSEAERLLRALVGMSSPMFPFTAMGSVRAGLREPSESAILVANTDAARDFAQRNGAGAPDGWLAGFVNGALGITPSIVDSLDRQVVSVVRRAIGFPLLAAIAGWGSEGAADLPSVERMQFVWVDERAARIPRDFDPIDTVEIAWMAALASHEGILVESEDGSWSWRGRQIATGLADLLRYLLLLERGTFLKLSEEVWKGVRQRTAKQWEDVLPQVEAGLRGDASDGTPGSRSSADQAARVRLRQIVGAKLDALLAASAPSASTLWPHAFQTQTGPELPR